VRAAAAADLRTKRPRRPIETDRKQALPSVGTVRPGATADSSVPDPPTLGVEEEFHVVDLETRRVCARGADVLAGLPPGSFTTELQRSVVETNTQPVVGLQALRDEMWHQRGQLSSAAERLELGIVGAGSAPLHEPGELGITPNLRYSHMLAEYERLARDQVICGAQVHVGIADREIAVAVAQRIAPDLPVLLAASASSPFWRGEDTGYASYRTMIWSRWPTSGPFPEVGGAREYAALVRDLIMTRVITDAGMIYYDVRPSAHVPTLELRLCDACPRVDDVVLIAALFRALVMRAIAELAEQKPARPVARQLIRAGTWRAARSGLEGDLIDPRTQQPVSAPVALRVLADELRPELERSGDRDDVAFLVQDLLAARTSAAQQRDAFRQAERVEDVVDLLIEQTRGKPPPAGPAAPPAPGLLVTYPAIEGDEAVSRAGTAYELSSGVLDELDRLGPTVLSRREEARNRHQLEHDVTFAIAGETRPFPIDLVPRVVGLDDWHWLARGAEQRAVALELLLRDVYGRRNAVRAGVLPNYLIDMSPASRPGGALVPDGVVRASVVGIDVVRDREGKWRVLEDNLRVPSGLAYALHARRLLAAVMPELPSGDVPEPVESTIEMLLRALRANAPPNGVNRGDDVSVALLSQGLGDPAWWEHRTLAEQMGVPLVHGSDLHITSSGVFLHRNGERVRVDVLYRRLDEELLDHLPAADRQPLGRRLRGAARDGLVTLANALGNGLGDDKAIYAFVGPCIRHYLGEEPLLADVPTYLCADPAQLSMVLDRMRDLVVKPVDGYGGSGVLIGPAASRSEIETARRELLAAPSRWIAQEVVALSTHPTLVAGRLEPRHVDLRVFVTLRPGDDDPARPVATALPAPLTRMAPAGSLIVNSSRGGGAKDTWITS